MIIVFLAHKKAKWRQHLNYILALDWNIWVDLCNLLSLTTIGRNQTHQPLEDWIWNCLSSLFILLWPTSWSSCDSADGQKNKTILQTVHQNDISLSPPVCTQTSSDHESVMCQKKGLCFLTGWHLRWSIFSCVQLQLRFFTLTCTDQAMPGH